MTHCAGCYALGSANAGHAIYINRPDPSCPGCQECKKLMACLVRLSPSLANDPRPCSTEEAIRTVEAEYHAVILEHAAMEDRLDKIWHAANVNLEAPEDAGDALVIRAIDEVFTLRTRLAKADRVLRAEAAERAFLLTGDTAKDFNEADRLLRERLDAIADWEREN